MTRNSDAFVENLSGNKGRNREDDCDLICTGVPATQLAKRRYSRITGIQLLGRGGARSGERGQPCDPPPQDEVVNVVRSFVGIHRLQIRHVPHNRILIQNTVSSMYIPRSSGNLKRDVDVVHFGEAYLLVN